MAGVREMLNKRPGAVLAVLAGLVAIGCMISWTNLRPPRITPPKYAYFTADDGKSFFKDDYFKVAPFQNGDHEVDAAKVFSGRDGTLFVAYLERATDDTAKAEIQKLRKEAAEQLAAHPTAGPDAGIMNAITAKLEVKRPGGTKWVKATSHEAEKILIVTCPDGSNPELAIP